MNLLLSLSQLNRQVWMQAVGRGLYQAGYGLIQFYTPIIFVNQVGLSATAVGIGIGSASIANAVGNLLGGTLADSPRFGRRGTLLFSAGLSTLASFVLALTHDLPMLVVSNLLLGLSMGLYWTAADATVMDVTTLEQRHQAFAVLGVADNLGVGIAVLGGGILVLLYHAPIFIVGSLIFLVFLMFIQVTSAETRQGNPDADTGQRWSEALHDKSLRSFVLVNILFTTYIALVNSTVPLYFTFVSQRVLDTVGTGSPDHIASLFTWWYIGFGAVVQLPIAHVLGSLDRARPLMISMLLWGFGFFLVWAMGGMASVQLTYEIGALGILAIATVTYKPFASALMSELAPESLRGVYTAIGYQSWAVGYFIGPILGGWAMDQPQNVAHNSWIVTSLSTICGLIILYFLDQNKVSNDSNFRQFLASGTDECS